MILELYAIKDTKAAFTQPIVCPNEGFALRMFIGSVRAKAPNAANVFPEDKEFWRIGYMDDQTGDLKSDLKRIAFASSYVLPPDQQEELTKKEVPHDGNDANG